MGKSWFGLELSQRRKSLWMLSICSCSTILSSCGIQLSDRWRSEDPTARLGATLDALGSNNCQETSCQSAHSCCTSRPLQVLVRRPAKGRMLAACGRWIRRRPSSFQGLKNLEPRLFTRAQNETGRRERTMSIRWSLLREEAHSRNIFKK
jgi:hypothetical protein